MNSSDQGNKQAMSEPEQEMDIGIEGFSYGEVRRLDRHRTSEGNRQSSTEHGDGASRQGGSEQSSS
jgi:hypothetical protein